MPLPSRVADLTPYDLLLSVAALGSMGRAARAHGVSQAAVSARLRALEGAVGLTLLDRGPRGARLTGAGALVVDWARRTVDAAEALDAGITSLRSAQATRLRVAASMTVAEYLLPRWLVTLRRELPATSVSLSSRNSGEVAADVVAGAADVGFVEGPSVSEDLDRQVVARDRLTLVVAPQHAWARRRRGIDPARLAATPLVAREAGSGTRAALEAAVRAVDGGALADPVLELSSTTAIKGAVADGIAPAVMSSLAVATEVADGSLVAVPVAGLELERRLSAVWPRGRPLVGPAAHLVGIAARPSRHAEGPAPS
ncbi:LysR family transcriptional regulator [Actinomycetospora straminea]|uniref:LysR family transcriptional regulator n=1 Tax=Actinomycetospora straminea TaxID=663607 RepID=A0ABP9ELW9_9PSEU|nr:LysR family transcriptional regulator [Actinomycetospora straminea]MDD7933308.1 LysR family transcriptional regulator [Actinomycetospora straminea]